jgi:hypothetical protein
VIGDKRGSGTSRALEKEPFLLQRLRRLVRVPVKTIQIVRNPFDNIATQFRRLKRGTLDAVIDTHLRRNRFLVEFRRKVPEADYLLVRHEEIIENPSKRLAEMCRFLGLDPAPDYLRDCAGIVYKSPHQSRRKVEWTSEQIRKVQAGIREMDFLNGYSFES